MSALEETSVGILHQTAEVLSSSAQDLERSNVAQDSMPLMLLDSRQLVTSVIWVQLAEHWPQMV